MLKFLDIICGKFCMNNEKFLKHALLCIKRRQESYVVLYRTFNPVFLEYENRLKKALKDNSDIEGVFRENRLKKELLQAVDIEFEPEFNNKRFKTSFYKAADLELSNNLYQKEVIYKKEEMPLSNWEFQCGIDCKEWFTLINEFSYSKVVSFDTGTLRHKYRVELLNKLFRVFPTVYINSSNAAMMKLLLKSKNLDIAVVRNNAYYKCRLVVPENVLYEATFTENNRPFDKRLCKSLNKSKKSLFIKSNNCLLNCRYYIDRFKCSRSRIVGMRPYTFLTQTIFMDGSHVLYRPRNLMIIDNVSNFVESLRSYFSFYLGRESKDLKTVLKSLIIKADEYKKRGWDKLIEATKIIPPLDHGYPSVKTSYLSRELDKTVIYNCLVGEGKRFTDGLLKRELNDYFKIKDTIFKIIIAISSKSCYTVSMSKDKYLYIPKDVKHIIEKHIKPYASYFLLLNPNDSQRYKNLFE